jgi:hypothetical protein
MRTFIFLILAVTLASCSHSLYYSDKATNTDKERAMLEDFTAQYERGEFTCEKYEVLCKGLATLMQVDSIEESIDLEENK